MNKTSTKDALFLEEIELIVSRLETISPKVYFSSGHGDSISRDEMIQHVLAKDDIGKEFVETEMEFLRALKDGKLLKQLFQQEQQSSFVTAS